MRLLSSDWKQLLFVRELYGLILDHFIFSSLGCVLKNHRILGKANSSELLQSHLINEENDVQGGKFSRHFNR